MPDLTLTPYCPARRTAPTNIGMTIPKRSKSKSVHHTHRSLAIGFHDVITIPCRHPSAAEDARYHADATLSGLEGSVHKFRRDTFEELEVFDKSVLLVVL